MAAPTLNGRPPRPTIVNQRLITAVLALGLGVVLVRCLPVLEPILAVALDHCGAYACDFKRVFWPQFVAVAEPPVALSPKWFYPPLLAVVFAPLGWLSGDQALLIWTVLNLGLVCWLVLLCRRALEPWGSPWSWVAAVGVVGLSLPVWHGVRWGQVSLMLTVPALWALSNRHRLTAPVLGWAAGVKVYPLAWIAALLVRRRWRTAVAAGVWAVLLGVLLPLAVLGRSVLPFYERVLVAPVGAEVAALGGQALGPSLVRWLADGRHGGVPEDATALLIDLGSTGALVVEVLAILALVVALGRWLRRSDLEDGWIAAALLLTLALVLRPGWHHYFVALPLAQAMVLGRARPSTRSAWLVLISIGVGSLPLLLLRDVPFAFFRASQWGVTTVSALVGLAALLTLRDLPMSVASPEDPPTERVTSPPPP